MNPNEVAKLKEQAPIPLILLLILFFLPAFLLEPEAEALGKSGKNYDASLEKAAKLIELRQKYDEQSQYIGQLQKVKNDLLTLLPQESALAAMIDSLHQRAAACSVVVEQVSYGFSSHYEKLAVPGYDISMKLTSDYQGIRALLADLETMPTPVIIKEVVMNEERQYVLAVRLLVK